MNKSKINPHAGTPFAPSSFPHQCLELPKQEHMWTFRTAHWEHHEEPVCRGLCRKP